MVDLLDVSFKALPTWYFPSCAFAPQWVHPGVLMAPEVEKLYPGSPEKATPLLLLFTRVLSQALGKSIIKVCLETFPAVGCSGLAGDKVMFVLGKGSWISAG